MEFLSLSNVLNALARPIELEPHLDSLGGFQDRAFQAQVSEFWAKNNPQIEWARKRAVAAQSLNRALHHPVGTLPRWMGHDDDMGFAVENDSVKPEIINFLTLMTKWASLLQNRCATYIRDITSDGLNNTVDVDYVKRQYQDIAPEMMRQQKIGFDLHEAILFFDTNELAHIGLVEVPLVRTQHARDLNFFYARIVRAMLAEGDKKGLQDTGCGTEDEARVMVKCYELATLTWWDIEALTDASDFDGIGLKFGESREAVTRRLQLAMKGKEAAEVVRPVDGVALLHRLGIRVVEELEETVSHLNNIGFYDSEAEGRDASVGSELVELAVDHTEDTVDVCVKAALRKIPSGGDSLTPLIWTVCYDLHEAGKNVTPRPVMTELKALASKMLHPLMGTVAGGVAYEFEKGEQRELNAEQLRKRIGEWKSAAGG